MNKGHRSWYRHKGDFTIRLWVRWLSRTCVRSADSGHTGTHITIAGALRHDQRGVALGGALACTVDAGERHSLYETVE